jgi:MATE family multidrug resistance protein
MVKERSGMLARLLAIALPMVISQAMETINMFVGRLFLSRLGEATLSAAMSGGLTAQMLSCIFAGTVGYTNAIVAQHFGAGRLGKCAQSAVQGLILAVASYPLILAASPLARHLFVAAGQSPLQVELAHTYFRVLIYGSIFGVIRSAITGFFLGVGRTRVVMIANFAGMAVNVPAQYVLIHGKLGLPALGLAGGALGAVLGSLTALLMLLIAFLGPRNRRDFATHQAFHVDGATMMALVRFGLPAGLEMFLNTSAFNLFIQFMHSYGPAVAASVTIAFNWDIVAFVPMLGMGFAVTSVVGQYIGAGERDTASRVSFLALRVAWIYAGTMSVLFLTATPLLVGVFASGSYAPTVAGLARRLVRLAALYLMGDAAHVVFAGALRGAGDTRWVAAANTALHWAFAVAAIVLIRVVAAPPAIVFAAFVLFVVLVGVVMYARFRSGAWRRIEMVS